MRRFLALLFLLLVIGVAFAAGVAWTEDEDASGDAPRHAERSDRAPSQSGRVSVRTKPASAADRPAAKLVADSELVDETVAELRRTIALPKPLAIVMGGDDDGPYYDPETRTIQYPWSFVTESRRLLRSAGYSGDELDSATVDATRFILHHELGHALIDQLDLPVLGREEDAADGFAAFVAVDLEDDGELVIGATDVFGAYDDQTEQLEEADFFDSHSLDRQRFYSISCLVYGADPKRYASVIDGMGFDAERRDGCVEEWDQLEASWRDVLEPHVRD